MPYPAQIDRDTAIDTACALIEASGIDGLSLARLASELGIKAPSLYHHFGSKADLLQGVALRTSETLVVAVSEGIIRASGQGPQEQMRAMGMAYRAFALAHPATFRLAFGDLPPDIRPDPAKLEALAIPLQASMVSLAGEAGSLSALRSLWALIHGFVILELSGQFQRGGDLEQTLIYAIDTFTAGLTHSK